MQVTNTTIGSVLKKKAIVVLPFFAKQKPNHIEFGTGIESMDFEGRNLRVDYDNVSVMSMYLLLELTMRDYPTSLNIWI